MKNAIVADGSARLRAALEAEPRLRALREAIEKKYATELAGAGLFRRHLVRLRLENEWRRQMRQELQQTMPSGHALYFASRNRVKIAR